MKKLFIGLTLFSAISSMAATRETINVESFLYKSNIDAKTCIFETMKKTYQNGEEVIKIFVNSDEAANINFAFELKPSQVPLKNGKIKTRYNNTMIMYKKGILTYTSEDKDGLKKDVTRISIKIDKNLVSPKEVVATEKYTGKIRSFPFFAKGKLTKKIHCKF